MFEHIKMEKKTWTEEGWDYSNKQKKQMRAEQQKKEEAETRRKRNVQKKNAAAAASMKEKLESISEEETEFEKSAVLVDTPKIESNQSLKTWWWW